MAEFKKPIALPINASATVGQLIEHGGKVLTTVKEGEAYILIPPDAPLLVNPNAKDEEIHQSVFYNPIQQYNRDLSVLAIRTFGEDYVPRTKQGKYRSEKVRKRTERNVQKRADWLKRKREANNIKDRHEELDVQDDEKRMRLSTESFPNPEHVNGHDTAVFSSMAQNGVDPTDDLDDSFGDGGLADEDFLIAEKNARQAGIIANTQSQVSGGEQDDNKYSIQDQTNPQPKTPRVPFRILDALSATGLRALRYAKEIPFVTSVTANDLSAEAVASIQANIEHNALSDPNLIHVTTGNAVSHMAALNGSTGPKYTVIDLDPYGTAVPFLDSAVQAVADGGLLCVTCTDSAVFNSMGYVEKTYSQYGGLPIKGDFYHEAGVRLILHAIATAAGRYGIAMEPLLSLSIDYYARVFVRLRRSPAEVKFLGGKTMLVYNCDSGCGAWTTQPIVRNQTKTARNGRSLFKHSAAQGPTTTPLCEHCGFKTHVAGPMYGGPVHNPAFVQKLLDNVSKVNAPVYATKERIRGMLTTILEETSVYSTTETSRIDATTKSATSGKAKEDLEKDEQMQFARLPPELVDNHPFYFDPSSLARILRCAAPSRAQMQGALRHLGYTCVRSHGRAGSIKTSAPWSALWDVMKAWVRQKSPIRQGALGKTTAGYQILNKGKAEAKTVEDGWEEVFNDASEMKVIEVDGSWRVMRKVTAQADERTQPFEANFDEELGRKDFGGGKGLLRYQINPRENWGPMSRAKVKDRH